VRRVRGGLRRGAGGRGLGEGALGGSWQDADALSGNAGSAVCARDGAACRGTDSEKLARL